MLGVVLPLPSGARASQEPRSWAVSLGGPPFAPQCPRPWGSRQPFGSVRSGKGPGGVGRGSCGASEQEPKVGRSRAGRGGEALSRELSRAWLRGALLPRAGWPRTGRRSPGSSRCSPAPCVSGAEWDPPGNPPGLGALGVEQRPNESRVNIAMQGSFYCCGRAGGSWQKSGALSKGSPCLLAVGRAQRSIGGAAGAQLGPCWEQAAIAAGIQARQEGGRAGP